MSHLFRNRYRVSSSRAPWWKYRNGFYFVTICTKNRTHFFGEILNGEMFRSEIGNIALLHWQEIPNRFSYVKLGAYVIMPNHVHGIFHIHGLRPHIPTQLQDSSTDNSNNGDTKNAEKEGVETRLIKRGGITGIHNPMLHQNLSRVMRWYTGRVSYESHKINSAFDWQGRFHDRILWDNQEYEIKTVYIQNNIKNWKDDDFF